jgi:hypothetical protein
MRKACAHLRTASSGGSREHHTKRGMHACTAFAACAECAGCPGCALCAACSDIFGMRRLRSAAEHPYKKKKHNPSERDSIGYLQT